MLHLLQMSPIKVLTTLLSRFRTLGGSHSCSCSPCCIRTSSGDSIPTNIVTSYQHCDSSSLYTSTAQSGSSVPLFECSTPTHPRFQTSYPPFAPFLSSPSAPSPSPHASGYFSTPPASSSPLIPSEFFNEMLGVSEPVALNFYTLFCLIPLTLFVSRNLTLIYLPLSGYLDAMLCDLIAPTPSLVFFLLMPHTLAVASSFSSGRAYSSWNFLLPLFLRLAPTPIM